MFSPGFKPLLLLTCLVPGCLGFRSPTSDDLTLLEATSYVQMTGIRGGGKTTEYSFRLLLHREGIRFDTAWVGQDGFPVKVFRNRVPAEGSLHANDTLVLHLAAFSPAEEAVSPNAPPASPLSLPPPIRYQGAALIRYFVKDQPRFLVCQKIEGLKD